MRSGQGLGYGSLNKRKGTNQDSQIKQSNLQHISEVYLQS